MSYIIVVIVKPETLKVNNKIMFKHSVLFKLKLFETHQHFC